MPLQKGFETTLRKPQRFVYKLSGKISYLLFAWMDELRHANCSAADAWLRVRGIDPIL
jgi:hypothetical protein